MCACDLPWQPAFFEPLRQTFKLHFAEDFVTPMAAITNNYALYAVETLLFFGSQASVESLSFQSGWFVDACFPGSSLRGGRGRAGGGVVRTWAANGVNVSRMAQAHADHPGAVDIQCRDNSGVLINGVLYGPACGSNLPCGRRMYLAPQPTPCGQPPLTERLMLTNRSFVAKGKAAKAKGIGSAERMRCAAREGQVEVARGEGRAGFASGAPGHASRNTAKTSRAHVDAAVSKVQGFLRGASASATAAAEAKGLLKAVKKRGGAGAAGRPKGTGAGKGSGKGGAKVAAARVAHPAESTEPN